MADQGAHREDGAERPVAEIFEHDIFRRIEEVVKADQEDERVVKAEIAEYVVTDGLAKDFALVLEAYADAVQRPTEGVGVWVSGFFGSGKSAFAKVLGHIVENRDLGGTPSSGAFERRLPAQGEAADRVRVLLRQINERVPTLTVILDVLTEKNARKADDAVSVMLYQTLLRRLGYAQDIDIAEIEYTLERQGRLDDFIARYADTFGGSWQEERDLPAFSRQRASRILHEMDPQTHPAPDSYLRTAKPVQTSARMLAHRFLDLMDLRGKGWRLVFVADEVGQYIAHDLGKVQDVQGLIHAIGEAGEGRVWLVATSQEKLDEVVRGLEGRLSDISRLQDRFPVRVDLAPKDITEVAAKRVLGKRAEPRRSLREAFGRIEGTLRAHALFSGTARGAGWSAEAFADFYPLLPDRAHLLVAAVDGLRAGARGAGQTGGSNRTLIKLAQQAVVHPVHGVGRAPLGALFTLDRAYGLLEGSFPSETRAELDRIRRDFGANPLCFQAAACVALLERIHDLPATAENVAAALHPSWDAPGRLGEVEAALAALVAGEGLRKIGPRYEVITAGGRDWGKERNGIGCAAALPALRLEFVRQVLRGAEPYRYGERSFTARVRVGREWLRSTGDLDLHVVVEDEGVAAAQEAQVREESRAHPAAAHWLVGAREVWDRALEEVYRSRQMIERYAPRTRGADEDAPLQRLVRDETVQLEETWREAARRATAEALLGGTLFWEGVASPAEQWATEPAKVVSVWVGKQVPKTFTKLDLANVRVADGDARRMLAERDLSAAPRCARGRPEGMGLVVQRGSQWVVDETAAPCAEVLARLGAAGGSVGGRQLETEFHEPPYGWDVDALMVVVAALLRAGRIQGVAKGHGFRVGEAAAAAAFEGPAVFRAASFAARQSGPTVHELARAAHALQQAGGTQVPVEEGAVMRRAAELAAHWRGRVQAAQGQLAARRWPAAAAPADLLRLSGEWEQGRPEAVVQAVGAGAEQARVAEAALTQLEEALRGGALQRLERGWEVRREGERLLSPDHAQTAELAALLDAEDFYLRIPAIDGAAARLAVLLEARAADLRERLGADVEAAAAEVRLQGERLKVAAGPVGEAVARVLALRDGLGGLSAEQTAARLAAVPGARSQALEALAKAVRPDGRRVPVRLREVLPALINTREELEPALAELRARCQAVLDEGGTVVLE